MPVRGQPQAVASGSRPQQSAQLDDPGIYINSSDNKPVPSPVYDYPPLPLPIDSPLASPNFNHLSIPNLPFNSPTLQPLNPGQIPLAPLVPLAPLAQQGPLPLPIQPQAAAAAMVTQYMPASRE